MSLFDCMKNIFVALLVIGNVDANPLHQTCVEPYPSEVPNMFSGINDIHESFGQMRYHNTHHTNDIRHFKSVTTTIIPGYSTACRRTDDTINSVSSCPWHYVLNVDPNRIPQSIVEARCNCRNRPCVGGSGNSRCEPLKYNIRVLRKYGCEDGVFLYKRTFETITVGCTCVLAH